MKRIIIILISALILGSSIIAQEATIEKPTAYYKPKSEIGFAAGFVSGYGLSYRYWPKAFGVQLTAFPMISNKESYISVGLVGLYELDASSWYRFYMFLGGNMNFQNYEQTNYNNSYDPFGVYLWEPTITKVKRTKYSGGFGPGIEFTPGGRIGLNIMTGFQFMYVNANDWGTAPTIEAAVYFRF